MNQYKCLHFSQYYESDLIKRINSTLDARYVPISISVTKANGQYIDAYIIVKETEQQIIDN